MSYLYNALIQNFKSVMLNEISQTVKVAYCVIPFMTLLQKQPRRTEIRCVVVSGLRRIEGPDYKGVWGNCGEVVVVT